MSESDWDGTEDRAEHNRVKKEEERKRKHDRIVKAAHVGKFTVGVRPVKSQSYTFFNKITADFNEAKKMAAAEFMVEYLKFDLEELSDMDITDTKISPKGDDILYIVYDCPEKALNVRRRMAECKNQAIKSRDGYC